MYRRRLRPHRGTFILSKDTAIQWCDSTINPVMGCSGCELWTEDRHTCYAGQLHVLRKTHKGFSPDFLKPKLFPGRMAEAAKWSDLTGTLRSDKPWLDRLPRLIFVSDMGDALSEKDAIDPNNTAIDGGSIPFEFLKREIIDNARTLNGGRHQWLWLTKRPNRLSQFGNWFTKEHRLPMPLNVWVGTSITGQSALGRIAQLRKVGNANTIRFLSVEPLWEKISLAGRLDGISWVIVGGESSQGAKAQEFKLEWVIQLVEDCADAGVPLFIKQLGSFPTFESERLVLPDRHGGDWSHWPANLRIRKMPL
jgi:protein gp37